MIFAFPYNFTSHGLVKHHVVLILSWLNITIQTESGIRRKNCTFKASKPVSLRLLTIHTDKSECEPCSMFENSRATRLPVNKLRNRHFSTKSCLRVMSNTLIVISWSWFYHKWKPCINWFHFSKETEKHHSYQPCSQVF